MELRTLTLTLSLTLTLAPTLTLTLTLTLILTPRMLQVLARPADDKLGVRQEGGTRADLVGVSVRVSVWARSS